ncbi:hypothetical protein GCM10010377_15780 [Streptomyces viridiviolaceus]|nr:hypothetical protein GCM10010377_15780 [Streptomyces viridiviolaceus]
MSGPPGEPPEVQPLHFAYDAGRGVAVTHLARPDPVWRALEANPNVLLSVVDDYVYVPGPWQAAPDTRPEHGVPTSFYAAVQLRCRARVVDDPDEKADLLNRQVGHFQPEGGSARAAAGEAPYRTDAVRHPRPAAAGDRRTGEVQVRGQAVGRGPGQDRHRAGRPWRPR